MSSLNGLDAIRAWKRPGGLVIAPNAVQGVLALERSGQYWSEREVILGVREQRMLQHAPIHGVTHKPRLRDALRSSHVVVLATMFAVSNRSSLHDF